jgi:mutator protein MutT
MRIPEEADRDFTAGTFVVKDGKVLLLRHKKLDKWLMPGGHIEKGETPDETAVRETREETGLEVEVIGEEEKFDNHSAVDLPTPFNMNFHEIREGHWHCDFQYLAKISGKRKEEYEYTDENINWVSKKELENREYEMPENVRKSALKAIKMADEDSDKSDIIHEGASAVLKNSETGKFLLMKRSEDKDYHPGVWEFPGGEIEDETPEEAARRELKEETGLEPDLFKKVEPYTWKSDHSKMKTHAFLFKTESEEVDLSREHVEYRWVELGELEELESFKVNKLDIEALGLV